MKKIIILLLGLICFLSGFIAVGRVQALEVPGIEAGKPGFPRMDVVDVSSHQGELSTSDFKIMKSYGVKGVIVKLTESTSYRNPKAKSQINNAKAAGLEVGVYHYSWYTTPKVAQAEAEYFIKFAKELGLSSNTLVIDDLEDGSTKSGENVTANATAFNKQLKDLGYTNTALYTGPSYINETKLNTSFIGDSRVWIAAYPYYPSSNDLWYSNSDSKLKKYGMWQWNDRVSFPGINEKKFDVSIDYAGLASGRLKLNGLTWQKPTGNNGEVDFGVAYQSTSKVTFNWQYYDLTNKTWTTMAANTTSNWVSFKAPHAGEYLIYVQATNADGDTRDYAIGWTVDEALKLTGMTWQKSETDDSKVDFGIAYQSSSKVTFDWQYYDLANKTWITMAVNTTSNWVTFKAPHAGEYLIYVKATNANGETRDYTIGWHIVLPLKLSGMTWQKLTSDNGEANIGVKYQSNSQVSFEWLYYDLANKTWATIAANTTSNWITFKAPHAGQYLIYVRAKNLEGETKDYSIGWTVDESINLTGMTWQKLTVDGSQTNFGIAYKTNSRVTFNWQYYDISSKTWEVISSNSLSNWVTAKLPKNGQYLIYVEAKTTGGVTATYSIGWNVATTQ